MKIRHESKSGWMLHAHAGSTLLALALAGCGGKGNDQEPAPPEGDPPPSFEDRLDGYGPMSPSRCEDSSRSFTMQAEDAELTSAAVGTEYAGYEGAGYVSAFDHIGAQVSFEFCVPEPGYYTLGLRYANGSHFRTLISLLVDGEVVPGEHQLPSRWAWQQWEPTTERAGFQESVLLDPGRHRVTVAYEPSDTGSAVIDSLTVSRGPEPSSTSVSSMLLNDWDQLVAGVFASRLYPGYDKDRPPRIGELRWRGNWQANNVDTAAGFLRDDTANQAYTTFDRFPLLTNIWLEGGILDMSYLSWGQKPLPAALTKHHALVPEQGLLVVSYDLRNVTQERRDYSLLEYVDLNRTGTAPNFIGQPPDVSGTMHVEWREDLQAFIADLSELHGTYVVFGPFQEPDEISTGPAGGGTLEGDGSSSSGSSSSGSSSSGSGGGEEDGGAAARVESLVQLFHDNEPLREVEQYAGDDAEMGLVARTTLEPDESTTLAYFYGVAGSLDDAEELARKAQGSDPDQWLARTREAWDDWLDERHPLGQPEPALDRAYRTALASIKHNQQPEFGSFVASTNPAYHFKVWPRDASVVAMGLDAAGYPDEAEHYWRWMADVQELGDNPEFPSGTYWTNYSFWKPDEGLQFVQPEWDSLGLFLIGVYRHYLVLLDERGQPAADQFLERVWPAARRSAEFITEGIDFNGLGPVDYSIWEDRRQYATFTQVTYASGLEAAYELGQLAELEENAEQPLSEWLEASRTIRDSLLKPFDETECTGLWNPDGNYFMRGIDPDCRPDARVDASTDLLWVFGLLDVDREKVQQHRSQVLATLSPNRYYQGVSRYEYDSFYFSSVFSPGGPFESNVPAPTWPQLSMYVSMGENWLDMDELAHARLEWYVSAAGVGYMPPGEAVDWSVQQPLVSTAVEPVTGSWYLLALLVNQGLYEPRLNRVGFEIEHDGEAEVAAN